MRKQAKHVKPPYRLFFHFITLRRRVQRAINCVWIRLATLTSRRHTAFVQIARHTYGVVFFGGTDKKNETIIQQIRTVYVCGYDPGTDRE